jgi:hypothetical protein
VLKAAGNPAITSTGVGSRIGGRTEAFDCGNAGLHQIAKTGPVLGTLFDV